MSFTFAESLLVWLFAPVFLEMWCPKLHSGFQLEAFWVEIARRGLLQGVLLAALLFSYPNALSGILVLVFFGTDASLIHVHVMICNDARMLFCGNLSSCCPSGILNVFDIFLPDTLLSQRHHSPSCGCYVFPSIGHNAAMWLNDKRSCRLPKLFMWFFFLESLWNMDSARIICSGALCRVDFFLRNVFVPPSSCSQNIWTYSWSYVAQRG